MEKLEKRILFLLKKGPITIDNIKAQAKISGSEARNVIKNLRETHNIVSKKGSYVFSNEHPKTDGSHTITTGETHHKDLYMGDTHYNSKECDVKTIDRVIEGAYDKGVRNVFHAGDITDGYAVYRGHELALTNLTYKGQLDMVANTLPYKKDLDYYVINGNHDWSWQIKHAGNFVKDLSEIRDDVTYLGDGQGLITKDGVKILMAHGAGGGAYARMYKVQTFLREYLQDEEHMENLPNILNMGHYHQQAFMKYYGINTIMPGAFQDATEYTKRKGLCGPKGACIVEYDIEKNGRKKKLKNFDTTFIN